MTEPTASDRGSEPRPDAPDEPARPAAVTPETDADLGAEPPGAPSEPDTAGDGLAPADEADEPGAPSADSPPPIWSREETPAAEAAPEPGRRTWVLGGAVALALVLVAALCGAGVLKLVRSVQPPPREVVQAYLEATRDQDEAKLGTVSCGALRSGSLTELGGGGEAGAELFKDLTWTIVADRAVSSSTHEVEAKVTLPGVTPAKTVTMTFTVVEEEGWRVCGHRLSRTALRRRDPATVPR